MLTGSHLALSTMQVPMPSAVTLQVQQSPGHTIVWQGSALQVLVCGTHAMPAPHWVATQRSVSHLAVSGLQNCDWAQGTFQHGSGWHAPATQRS